MGRGRRTDYGTIILHHVWDMYNGHQYAVGNNGHPAISRRFPEYGDAIDFLKDMGYRRTGWADTAYDEEIWEPASSS